MANAIEPYIPVDAPDQLREYAKSSIVKLTHTTLSPKGKDGTAFFVRYKNETGEDCYGLMTNHHVIKFDPEEPIVGANWEGKPLDPLTVSLSSEKLHFKEELKLEEVSISYAFSCSRLDVTLLEFSQNEVDRFSAKNVIFLEMERDVSSSYGDCLHIYGHPGGGQLCKGEGRLVGQPTPLICYSVDTDQGCSGSPILKSVVTKVNRRKTSFRYQLVGIHHMSGDKRIYNCGTPIEAVMRAIDRDRPIALQELQYPRKQTEDAEEDILIQHLFGVDFSVATGLQTRAFVHTKYYNNPRLYEIECGQVKMTLRHSLQWDQFTLMDVLDDKHLAVPWRDWDFDLHEFKAFHELATALQRVCSLECSEYTGRMIVASLEEHLQRILNNFSLAGYYCRDTKSQRQMATIQKLKWAVMCKDGPEHLAQALVATRRIQSNELKAKLNQFKSNEATEVELIKTTAACLTTTTSQLRTLGRPPAALRTHVQRTYALAELSKIVTTSFEDTEEEMKSSVCDDEKIWAVSVWGMGGLGKTHLVLDVLQTPSVQRAFPNLIWHEVGQLTAEESIKKLADSIGAEAGDYMDNNVASIKKKLQKLQFKETLLVIDNVWSSDTAMHFLFDFPTIFTSRLRLVFDTNQNVASYPMPTGFKPVETAEVFKKCMRTNSGKDSVNDETGINGKTVELSELHWFCGGHPLVIAILARNIARKIWQHESGWDVIDKLKEAGLKVIELAEGEPIREKRHRNVFVMLTTLVGMMETKHQDCLHALRICKRGAMLTRNALKALFSGIVVEGIFDPANEADYLRDQALLQEEQPNVFTIHDVIFDLITKAETPVADTRCNAMFIKNFESFICPLEQVPKSDTYMTTHCGYHLLQANMIDRWVALFLNNIEFLEDVAEQGIDLFEEFTLAEKLFLEEEKLMEQDNWSEGPLLPNAALPICLALLYRRVKETLKPRENRHTAFITVVSQTLVTLIKRHGTDSKGNRQKSQERAITEMTRMLSIAMFARFRRQMDVPTKDTAEIDAELQLYLRAIEMTEKGGNLLSTIKKQAKPAEIRRLVDGMPLASFFETGEYGENCMHAAMWHEEPATIFDILKGAEVWRNQQLRIEKSMKMVNAMEKLKFAGLTALVELYGNFELQLNHCIAGRTAPFIEVLEAFSMEPHELTPSTILMEFGFRFANQNWVKAMLQSFVFQTHQFALADPNRWNKIKCNVTRENCDDKTFKVIGLWSIFAFVEITSTLHNCGNKLPAKFNMDLSWKTLICSETLNATPSTPLTMASRAGSEEAVSKLLQEAEKYDDEYRCKFINYQRNNGWTALHSACHNGHLQIVNRLLDNSANLLRVTVSNGTDLFLAAKQGHRDIVKSLLTHLKAKTAQKDFEQHVNQRYSDGRTAIAVACSEGHQEIVDQLLTYNVDLFRAGRTGSTCLHLAAKKGHCNAMQSLFTHLERKFDQQGFERCINYQNKDGYTPLHYACYSGQHQIISLLLSKNADFHIATINQNTCLHTAARRGHHDVVGGLLAQLQERTDQADFEQHISRENNEGLTALHYACAGGHTEIVHQLLSKSANLLKTTMKSNTCLHLAAQEGHLDVVSSLCTHLRKVTDERDFQQYLNLQGYHGNTAIRRACSKGYLQIVNLLLGHFADLLIQDDNSKTCLQVASQNGHYDVVQNLLTHLQKETDQSGFEQHINHQDCNGWTAFHFASYDGNLQIFNQLFNHSADLLTLTNTGSSCLHVASQKGYLEIVELIITVRPQLINHRTNHGVTPLQVACANGHVEIVAILLNNYANYLNADGDGDTCLQDAVLHQQPNTVRQVLKYVAEKKGKGELKQLVDHQNSKGETALHQACYKGSVEIVNVLLQYCGDVCLRDVNGDTCLQNAVLAEQSIMVEHTVKHVKDSKGQQAVNDLLNQENKRGLTAFDMAFSSNQKEMLELLLDSCTQFHNAQVEMNAYLLQRAVKWRCGTRARKWRRSFRAVKWRHRILYSVQQMRARANTKRRYYYITSSKRCNIRVLCW